MGKKSTPMKSCVMTRREVIRLGAAASGFLFVRPSSAFCRLVSSAQGVADVDHLLWGVSDLDEGIAVIEEKTGVRAVIGGRHPGRGTRNALISLGERHYLEILAPDPAQPNVQEGRVTVVRGLDEPRLLTWAAGGRDVEETERSLRAAGYQSEGIRDGSRDKPDGTVLRWRNLTVLGHDGDVVPFLIEWSKDSVHPSESSPSGCDLRELRLEHPAPEEMNAFLETMDIAIRAVKGRLAKISALIETPKGELELE